MRRMLLGGRAAARAVQVGLVLVAVLLVAGAPSAAADGDITPPVLSGLAVSPGSIEVSNEPGAVTVVSAVITRSSSVDTVTPTVSITSHPADPSTSDSATF